MKKIPATLLRKLQSNQLQGIDFSKELSTFIDRILTKLFKHIFGNDDLSLVALGGYGRSELCPFSDIDIMILTEKKTSKATEKKIEKFFYTLWDDGFKIGHCVRSVDDCITLSRQDAKIFTSLLDIRLIAGNRNDFLALQSGLFACRTRYFCDNFVTQKLKERDQRHEKMGDTRYVLEPNIKEGKGGLRDFQTLFWITDVIYGAKTPEDLGHQGVLTKAEARKFAKAYDFLLTVRCHLHDLAGRAEERLHFDIQPSLAERLGYANRNNAKSVERFMKHYFLVTRDIGDLTRIICAAIETRSDQKDTNSGSVFGFDLINQRLAFSSAQDLSAHPLEIMRLFRTAQETNADIHPSAIRKMTRHQRQIDSAYRHNPMANRLFIEILTGRHNASQTLRRMNEAGILGRFVTAFGHIIALMQFDRYHVYTVDEHTLRAVGLLHTLDAGKIKNTAPLATKLMKNISHRRALFVALFLHDICKGRDGDHSLLGAELALKLCPRFGLDDEETRLVSWLIFNHLMMSDTAFKRDLEDPKTIQDFTFRIEDPEKLDLLTILTTIDIMAVGPNRWTDWKARLIDDLHTKTHRVLRGEKTRISPNTASPNPDMLLLKTQCASEIYLETDTESSVSILSILSKRTDKIFALFSGAIAAAGLTITEARINTLEDGSIADTFFIQTLDGRPVLQKTKRDRLKTRLKDALNGKLNTKQTIDSVERPLSKKDIIFEIAPSVIINNHASRKETVIEVSGRDRQGLLYDLALCFQNHDLSIHSAKINTMGIRAEDVFYVHGPNHQKIADKKQITALKTSLETVLHRPQSRDES